MMIIVAVPDSRHPQSKIINLIMVLYVFIYRRLSIDQIWNITTRLLSLR